MDADHIVDYYLNHELGQKIGYLIHPKKLRRFLSKGYLKRKPGYRVYKPLHSFELLVPAFILYAFGIWNDIATGVLIGFLLHLTMDTLPLGHLGAMSIIYRASKGFPPGAAILKQRLRRMGRDTSTCQLCGAKGNTKLYKHNWYYAGFTRKRLMKIEILCPQCYDRVTGEMDD